MAQWLEQGNPNVKVVGLSLSFALFSQRTVYRNISVQTLFGTENVRENGGKTNPKCFGQLPLGTGSQRHMAEKF